jgi:drug/metabolite transporter (DMT)-like permease
MTRRGWLLFAAMSVIWGIPYLLIKVAVGEVAPAVVVAFRTGVAALVLVPVAAARGALRPALRYWPVVVLFALLEMAGPWILLADAEQGLSSSLTGLLVAAVPLVSTAVAFAFGDRTVLRPLRLAGLAIGLFGVALVVGFGRAGSGDLRQIAEVLLVAVLYAVAPFLVVRRLEGVPSLGVIALALSTVAALYLAPAVLSRPVSLPSPAVIGALLGLALICTALAFVVFFALLGEVGPPRAMLFTFVNPAVALGLGVLVLGEPLTVGLVLGFPLVIAGCWLGSRRPADAAPGGVPAGPDALAALTDGAS